MITEKHINQLFDYLWPEMPYAKNHKNLCIEKIRVINNCFKKFDSEHNKLLNSLSSIEGIGLTIGSGLIWVIYPNNRVPFDKYTLTYAIDLGIIQTNIISKNYVKYSEQIKMFCDQYEIDEINSVTRNYEIEDFVREAIDKLSGEYFIEPK